MTTMVTLPTTAATEQSVPAFVLLIGGLQSHSLETPTDHGLRHDFARLRDHLATTDPALRVVEFSYGAGDLIAAGDDPVGAWEGDHAGGGEPRYRAVQTTDRPVADHVAALDWQLSDLLRRYPGVRIDMIGFSLGGIVALAWAASVGESSPALSAIHRIVLVSCPVGGISSLGRLTPVAGIRHALRRFNIGFGRGLVFNDLRISSPFIAALRKAPGLVDVVSVENSRDYLVNGRRITGQRLLPIWVRTVPLGRGSAVSGFLSPEAIFCEDLGGWEQHLRTTHYHILRHSTPRIRRARQYIVDMVMSDGPIWTARQAGIFPVTGQSPIEGPRSRTSTIGTLMAIAAHWTTMVRLKGWTHVEATR